MSNQDTATLRRANQQTQVARSQEVLRAQVEFAALPPEAAKAIDQLWRDEERIREAEYQPSKESSLILERRETTKGELREIVNRLENEATSERDRDLKAVDEEIARASALPAKTLTTTDSEYTAALVKAQVQETRRLAALTAATLDVQAAAMSEDPVELAQIADDALTGGHPEVVQRVGRSVETRLAKLAAAEHPPGPAFAAWVSVLDRLRTWRAQEARRSPAARRQQIVERHLQRLRDIRGGVTQASAKFGLTL